MKKERQGVKAGYTACLKGVNTISWIAKRSTNPAYKDLSREEAIKEATEDYYRIKNKRFHEDEIHSHKKDYKQHHKKIKNIIKKIDKENGVVKKRTPSSKKKKGTSKKKAISKKKKSKK